MSRYVSVRAHLTTSATAASSRKGCCAQDNCRVALCVCARPPDHLGHGRVVQEGLLRPGQLPCRAMCLCAPT